jgi:hypothetical protein
LISDYANLHIIVTGKLSMSALVIYTKVLLESVEYLKVITHRILWTLVDDSLHKIMDTIVNSFQKIM